MRIILSIVSVADPEGFHRFPLKPPFGLAMHTRSVFSTDDYDMLKPPLPAKLICDRIWENPPYGTACAIVLQAFLSPMVIILRKSYLYSYG